MTVLLATKGAPGDEGLEDFVRWSAKSAKDVPEFSERAYRAARRARIGAGTIYFLAQQHGWKRPVDHTRRRIAALAKLSRIEYDRVRVAEAKALGVRISTFDAEVAKLRAAGSDEGSAFNDQEPSPETVDGAALLADTDSRGTGSSSESSRRSCRFGVKYRCLAQSTSSRVRLRLPVGRAVGDAARCASICSSSVDFILTSPRHNLVLALRGRRAGRRTCRPRGGKNLRAPDGLERCSRGYATFELLSSGVRFQRV